MKSINLDCAAPRVGLFTFGILLCGALWGGPPNLRAMPASTHQSAMQAWLVLELEDGFRLLYELKPQEARSRLEAWQKSHPEDPLGSAAEAAAYLFEECYRQGVLTSDFFLNNKRFFGKIPLRPDPKLRAAFFAAARRSQDLASARLQAKPNDSNALFALSLSLGMQADYASLIDKRQLDSLKKITEADTYSKRLLAVAPQAADAYLGLGTANYVIGSLSGIKRAFLSLDGIHGDKKLGIRQLQIAADQGHYLRPFAKVLLAMVALREKRPELASVQLKQLVAEFPQNLLFASELAKIKGPSAGASAG